MGKLRIAGTWSGVVDDVELDVWTIPILRQHVADRSGCSPEFIKMICAGKLLKDGEGTEKLSELGVKENSKIMATKSSPGQANALISQKDKALAEEERSFRLSRLKAAATSLAKRHADGSLPVEDFNMELETQSGEKWQMGSETDRRSYASRKWKAANEKAKFSGRTGGAYHGGGQFWCHSVM